MMKLRLEKIIVKKDEDVEFPDFSFNHAYNTVGQNEVEITYMVPASEQDSVKAQASEIAAHLMGRYR